MNGFIFVNASNMMQIWNMHGIWQLLICIAAFGVSVLINRFIINKYIVDKNKYPLRYEFIQTVKKTLTFALVIIIFSMLYPLFKLEKPYLSMSIAVFILGITIANILGFSIKLSLARHKKTLKLMKIIKIFLWLGVIFWATNLDEWLATNLATVNLVFGVTKVSLWFLLKQMTFIVFALALMFWANGMIDNFVKQAKEMDATQKQLLTRITKVFIVLIGIYVILPSLGIDLTALTVFGSAVGVGLGFGLQKIASNFLSGFIILLDRSIRIGDRIIVNGTTGIVTQITTRYTVMQAFDGSEVIIPNEQFITNTVINQTHSHNDIGAELVVSVGYSSDLTDVIETLRDCIRSIEQIRSDREPTIVIQNLNTSGIDIFIRVWPKDPLHEMSIVKNRLNIAIIEKFRIKGIEIPFPKLDVTLIKS